jgi:hypothetical protein
MPTLPDKLKSGTPVTEDWKDINKILDVVKDQQGEISRLREAVQNLRRERPGGGGGGTETWI